MSDKTALFIAKARKLLINASVALSVNLTNDAGRNAYLASFTAARAFVHQETGGKVFKSHKGVRTEFSRLTKDDPRFTPDQRKFLYQVFNLKAIADYEEGSPDISPDRAQKAIEGAKELIDKIAEVIKPPHPGTKDHPKATP